MVSWAWQKGRLEAWHNSGVQWKEAEKKSKASASAWKAYIFLDKATLA